MVRRLDWARVKPEDLVIELVTQPTITVPPEVDRAEILAPAWLRRFPSLLESRMRRRLLAQLEGPVAGAYAAFGGQLRGWLTAALAGLASQFTAQAEPMRAQARRAAEGGGAGDLAGVAADLAQIEGSAGTVGSLVEVNPAKRAGMMEESLPETAERQPASWFNRSTLGAGLASLFSDTSHELATAVLPAVLLSLGAGPAALGWIEGSADGLSAVAKLWGGVVADRVEKRKPLASAGYLVTAAGVAAIGLATRWWHVLLCRVIAWIGRGSRTAPRDVLISEAAPPSAQGKAFGLERAGDALGAVLGPLLALALLARGVEARHVMFASLLPGVLAFLSIVLLVAERPHAPSKASIRLRASLASTGVPFRRFLTAILIFGSGDFSRTLLILYATRHATGTLFSWTAATLAVALYVLHNAVSSAAAVPIGALSDRVGVSARRRGRLSLRRRRHRRLRGAAADAFHPDCALHRIGTRNRLRGGRRKGLRRESSSASGARDGDGTPRRDQRYRRLRLERSRRNALGDSAGASVGRLPGGSPPAACRRRHPRPSSETRRLSVRLRASALSDIGRVRHNDEDAFLVDEALGLFAVADGVGGHNAGEIASRIAVETLSVSFRDAADRGAPADAERVLENAFRSADEEIRRQAQSPDKRGMGSTLVVLFAPSAAAWTAHVGDSRAYLWRDVTLSCLTRDHSGIADLADRVSGPDRLRLLDSPLAHVLTRCLGMEGSAGPEIRPLLLQEHDRLLLCCDGLTDMVSEETVARILAEVPSRKECCRRLVDTANDAGGRDNVTVRRRGRPLTSPPVHFDCAADPPAAVESSPPIIRYPG